MLEEEGTLTLRQSCAFESLMGHIICKAGWMWPTVLDFDICALNAGDWSGPPSECHGSIKISACLFLTLDRLSNPSSNTNMGMS